MAKAKHLPFSKPAKKDGAKDAPAASAPALHLQVRDKDGNTGDFYAPGDGNYHGWGDIGDWNDQIVGFVCAVGDWTFYKDVNFNQLAGGGNTGGYRVLCPQGTVANWTDDVGIERLTISSMWAGPGGAGTPPGY